MILKIAGPIQKMASLRAALIGGAIGATAGASTAKKGERLKSGLIWGGAGALSTFASHPKLVSKLAHKKQRHNGHQ